jgi:BlaI family transcriptional regulator, penicillinase repressor
MKTRKPALSEAELRVLKALWDHGPGTVRQLSTLLNGRGRRWAYTTVLTLLQRLQVKGYVTSDTESAAHVFHPAATRDDVIRVRLKDVADQLCGGAPTPLVLALVEGHKFSEAEIAQFRQVLDQIEEKKPSRGR